MEISKVPSTVFTALDDGTGVLLNLETRLYYSLNHTGVAVWREVDSKTHLRLEDAVSTICDRFDVSPDAAQIDLRAFVEHLARFKMVRIA